MNRRGFLAALAGGLAGWRNGPKSAPILPAGRRLGVIETTDRWVYTTATYTRQID